MQLACIGRPVKAWIRLNEIAEWCDPAPDYLTVNAASLLGVSLNWAGALKRSDTFTPSQVERRMMERKERPGCMSRDCTFSLLSAWLARCRLGGHVGILPHEFADATAWRSG